MNNKRGAIVDRMLKLVLNIYRSILKLFLWPQLYMAWRRPKLREINERVIEYGYALSRLGEICPATVLDIGPGSSSWPQILANCGYRVTAIDTKRPLWRNVFFNSHYHILKDDIAKPRLKTQFDLITCISVLEHISDFGQALEGMVRLLNWKGCIILTVPYNEKKFVDDVYQTENAGYNRDAPYICHVFSRAEIDTWIHDYGLVIVDQKYYQVFSGELWTTGRRLVPPREVSSYEKHHLSCLVLRKRK